jgi:hypothetical protein
MDTNTRLLPSNWRSLAELSSHERTSVRWLLRFATTNRIVEKGVAVKLGKRWYINSERLPEFLQAQTVAAISGRAQ